MWNSFKRDAGRAEKGKKEAEARFLLQGAKNTTMSRFRALVVAVFMSLVCAAGVSDALSINIEPNINNTFVNDRTKMSIVLEEAEYLWYRADNGTESFLDIIGNGYPEMPVIDYFGGNPLDVCSNHTLSLFANDSAGLTVEAGITFTYDSMPPVAPVITYPENGSVLRTNNVTVSWNSSEDSCSGLNVQGLYEISVRGVGHEYSTLINEKNLSVNLPDGEYNLTVTAYDNVEPLSIANSNSSSISFTVDTSGPDVEILSPQERVYGQSVWFNLSLDREGSCTFDVGDGNVTMGSDDGLNFTMDVAMDEGEHDVVFYCWDEYNHISNSSKGFFVDLSPPNKTLEDVNGDFESPYNVSYPVTEIRINLSEPGSCRMSVENKSYSQMTDYFPCEPENSTEVVCRETLPDGGYVRYIACTDGFNKDGAESLMKVNFTVNIYYHLAVSIDASGYARAEESRNFTLNLQNDGNGNLTNLNLTLSSNMSGDWYRLWTSSLDILQTGREENIILTVTPLSPAENGSYVFTVYANATELNTSTNFTINVRADVTTDDSGADGGDSEGLDQDSGSGDSPAGNENVPAIVEMYPQGGYVNSRVVTVWVKTDKKSACGLDDEDKAFDNMKRNMLTTDGINHTYRFSGLANGEHKYYARCKYEDGNKMINSVVLKFTVDTGTPVTSVKGLEPEQNSTEFEVSWSGEDGLSGIESYTIQVKVDDGEWENWLTDTKETSAVFQADDGHIYRFRSIGRDKAGNVEIKIAIHEDTFTRVGRVTKIEEEGDGFANNLTDGITGFLSGLNLGDVFSGAGLSLSNFLSANMIPLILILIALPLLVITMRNQPVGKRSKTLRKHVMDEWRRIKSSLK